MNFNSVNTTMCVQCSLKMSNIKFALTINPIIYVAHITSFWNSVQVQTEHGVKKVTYIVDGKPITVTKSNIRSHLQFHDESGISSLPNQELFETFQRMGYEGSLRSKIFEKSLVSSQWRFLIHTFQQCLSQKRTGLSEIGSTLASAIVCLII